MTSAVVLGFDTSGPWCAACLIPAQGAPLTRVEEMARGQAERLMPLLEELLAEAGLTWADLDGIGVGVGPGNFTGIRIAVSAARGLGMGLSLPVVGVTGFDARAACHPEGTRIAISAPRDRIYVTDPDPQLVEASAYPSAVTDTPTDQIAAAIARLAAGRLGADLPAPAPLYVRAADAAPSRDVPPPILE